MDILKPLTRFYRCSCLWTNQAFGSWIRCILILCVVFRFIRWNVVAAWMSYKIKKPTYNDFHVCNFARRSKTLYASEYWEHTKYEVPWTPDAPTKRNVRKQLNTKRIMKILRNCNGNDKNIFFCNVAAHTFIYGTEEEEEKREEKWTNINWLAFWDLGSLRPGNEEYENKRTQRWKITKIQSYFLLFAFTVFVRFLCVFISRLSFRFRAK